MAELIGLDKLQAGKTTKIVKIQSTSGINKRIVDMGVIPGTIVQVKRIAPLGDPIDIKLKGYHLSLRKEEAANIIVELEE